MKRDVHDPPLSSKGTGPGYRIVNKEINECGCVWGIREDGQGYVAAAREKYRDRDRERCGRSGQVASEF